MKIAHGRAAVYQYCVVHIKDPRLAVVLLHQPNSQSRASNSAALARQTKVTLSFYLQWNILAPVSTLADAGGEANRSLAFALLTWKEVEGASTSLFSCHRL